MHFFWKKERGEFWRAGILAVLHWNCSENEFFGQADFVSAD
jgi:hypothetical protein